MNTKKSILASILAICTVCVLVFTWSKYASKTKIAFVNYQIITLGEITRANDNSSIDIQELDVEQLDKLEEYDMVFINAMGLKITEEQRDYIKSMAEDGLPILTTFATNPANYIVSIDSLQEDSLKQYITNGGRSNFRSALNYVRKEIDRKRFWVNEPLGVVKQTTKLLYHPNLKNPDDEDEGFNSISEYEAYLKENMLWKNDAPHIVITGQMADPTELIFELEKTGNVVYPVRGMSSFVHNAHIDTVSPSAIINMAHGRLGDYMVDYLLKRNIPLLCPLNVNRLVDDWENDKMGMSGGFLSQSIVMPEIDGAIRPYALFGHYKDEEGMQHVYAIPDRLEKFVSAVNRHIALQQKPNASKRIAIYYYKGPGQNAMTAAGMEVCPSLFNFLQNLKQEGYNVEGLPTTPEDLAEIIQKQGAVFGSYAKGAMERFIEKGNPALVKKDEYESWVREAMPVESYQEIVDLDGEFPGSYLSNDTAIAIPRIQFGNIVLIPQGAAGSGDNEFKVIHGTNMAPPHSYIASYLWTRFGFMADAMIHFGTHGSLEFTPRKQVALDKHDWSDILVGDMPHLYVYSISDVGEGMTAKRRSYAGLQSHLTPPFLESGVRTTYNDLNNAIENYNRMIGKADSSVLNNASMAVKELTVQLGFHRYLELDSILNQPYSEEDISRIEAFSEELAMEKITGQLYTMGVPYERDRITSSIYAMSVEPIAYSLLALDKQRGKATADIEKHASLFSKKYLTPANEIVGLLLKNPSASTTEKICQIANITKEELEKAHNIVDDQKPKDMMSMMQKMAEKSSQMGPANDRSHQGATHTPMMKKMHDMAKNMNVDDALKMAEKMGASPEALKKMKEGMEKRKEKEDERKFDMKEMMKQMMNRPTYSKEEINFAIAISEIERTILNVNKYKTQLEQSPMTEFTSLTNALNGGYTQPSPGGDPIANPNALPTGRNLYAINAEATPSERAWEKGVELAKKTIALYQKRHHDSIPRKVSYTLWSGEFIETEGATIAQVLYMLGVEPIRDAFGRVSDIRLIPSKELGRPRIDIVVQTSGQLRDLAASRLFLINRAVEMASNAADVEYENQVREGVVEAERMLMEKGLSPKEAREVSSFRVFGALNGGYGTGISGMVQNGDRWESDKEIADVYLNNMNAFYGSEKNWESVRQHAFEAALTRTDIVVQPRQSNTWGALSLDHVYEFMGGMNLAVRNVTGKDPDAYLSDYRNRNNIRMQELKEAVGVECKTTIFNPNYIKEKMKGEAGSAATFAEIIQNTYGWNVMKPAVIDNEMWDEIYDVYVTDKFRLNIIDYFEKQNPAALEEMTAVMLETARKGMWKATDEQISNTAKLHVELVNKFNPSCSGFVCDNAKLREFIKQNASPQDAADYASKIDNIRQSVTKPGDKGMIMRKEELSPSTDAEKNAVDENLVVFIVAASAIAILLLVWKRRKGNK